MQKQIVNILIPIYKEELSQEEYTSLRQCISVLSGYPITLVCPESLKLDVYFAEYSDFKVETFQDDFFKSLDGYNKLLMSKQFYHRFLNFRYILIYQLDAYVFRDELEYWCNLNFDYIGAPWFANTRIPIQDQKLYGVGNGGLSLRKVQSHYNALNFYWVHFFLKSLYESYTQYLESNLNQFSRIKLLIASYLTRVFFIKKSKYLITILSEDQYFCLVVPKINLNFKLAPREVGIKFSFEENPDLMFKMNNNELPFGCHAWARYNKEFWSQFIS